MQKNLRGLYGPLIPLPHPRPDSKDDDDLYQPFIPPIPAFFNAISVLMIFREKMTISDTRNDIGNGKTKVRITTITTEISSQAK